MRSYRVVETKAQEFANNRQAPVYIAKANNINKYKIEFANSTSKNYKIIKEITPCTN